MGNTSWLNQPQSVIIKGFRPVVEGFVITMHKDGCKKQEVKFDILFAQARVHWDNKHWQISLNHNYNITFIISLYKCEYSALEIWILCSMREPIHMLLPLFSLVVPLNDRNFCLTMPVVKGCCACDLLHDTFNIDKFKSIEKNSTIIKQFAVHKKTTIEVLEFPINIGSDWHWEFGDTSLPLLHMRLIDARHM